MPLPRFLARIRERTTVRFRLSILLLILLAILAYAWGFRTWHEPEPDGRDDDRDGLANVRDPDVDGDGLDNLADPDADGDGLANAADIVAAARRMDGVWYDFSMGRFDNLFGKMGFLVCIDVPRLAYADAGLYFEPLLRDDFEQHPEHYDTQAGTNTPATRFFFRRVHNLQAWCATNGRMVSPCKEPRVGDLIFYGSFHITMVSGAYPDGTIDEIETAPWTGIVVEHHRKRWIPMGVGRLLPSG